MLSKIEIVIDIAQRRLLVDEFKIWSGILPGQFTITTLSDGK